MVRLENIYILLKLIAHGFKLEEIQEASENLSGKKEQKYIPQKEQSNGKK